MARILDSSSLVFASLDISTTQWFAYHSTYGSLVLFTERHVIGNERVLQYTAIPKPAWVNLKPLSQGLHVLFFGDVHA